MCIINNNNKIKRLQSELIQSKYRSSSYLDRSDALLQHCSPARASGLQAPGTEGHHAGTWRAVGFATPTVYRDLTGSNTDHALTFILVLPTGAEQINCSDLREFIIWSPSQI